MNKVKICTLIFLFLSVTCGTAFCADAVKIGIIDFQRVLTESKAGKKAQEEISNVGNELKNRLEEMKKEIDELNSDFERQALVMSKEKRDEKQRDLRIKVMDFKDQQKQYESQFKEKEAELVRNIQKEVFDMAKTIGEKKGFLLIMARQAAGVIYAADHVDITDIIIGEYDKLAK
jgi:outer membrane protein